MNPHINKTTIAFALLGCSALLNVVLLVNRQPTVKAEAPKPVVQKPVEVVAEAPKPAELPQGEWKVVKANLKSTPSQSFQEAIGDEGDGLSQAYARLFVWDVNLRTDLSNGDPMAVAYQLDMEGKPDISVATLTAKKKGKTFRAYGWQAPGDAFLSFWNEAGTEVPLTLKNGPLKKYQQITSLLKDRPTHKGMDFKTPTGTEVYSPFAGTVLRTNWNWGANGNCVEVQYPDGTLAKFLHLSENRVKVGEKVEAGQVIALTGNTGHSTAPHLHYQLNQGEKVVDPLDYHGTERRQLDDAAMVQFKPVMQKLDALLADQAAAL